MYLISLYKQLCGWLVSQSLIRRQVFACSALCTIFILSLVYIGWRNDSSEEHLYIHLREASSKDLAQQLSEKNIISHPRLFSFTLKALSPVRTAQTGEYYFDKPQHELIVLLRILLGDRRLNVVSVTIPEGLTVVEIATLLERKIPDFDAGAFSVLAQPEEGYLFPDTYFFFPGDSPQKIVNTLKKNFHKKIGEVATTVEASTRTVSELVIMASLLEKEAANTADRRLIAGVLWNRIKKGMPLQVDAVFPYIIGKNTFTLTKADLLFESPYNTYLHKGLPIGPIANPGIDSLLSAMTPTQSAYLFYLSDHDGKLYFSETYKEHLTLKRIHLP